MYKMYVCECTVRIPYIKTPTMCTRSYSSKEEGRVVIVGGREVAAVMGRSLTQMVV